MRLVIHESEVSGSTELCGVALDLIHPETTGVRNVSVATIIIEPALGSRAHFHRKMEEIYYFIEGRGEVTLGNEVHAVRPGSAVYIPVGLMHQVKNTATEPLRFLSIDSPVFDPTDIFY
jgi:mannose-6-phosphate isomerase-like protein (cupin superfamily)